MKTKWVIGLVFLLSLISAVAMTQNIFAQTSPADLSITMTEYPDMVYGGNLIYTIQIKNNGPNTATGVTLIDAFSPNSAMNIISISLPVGSCTTNQDIICNLGTLTPGEYGWVTLITSPTQGGVFTNTASVSANEWDPNPFNNTTSITNGILDIWTPPTPPTHVFLSSVAYGNNTFIATGYNGTVLTSNSTGDTWTTQPPTVEGNLDGIGFGNGLFIASSPGQIIVSNNNGQSWDVKDVEYHGLYDVGYGDGTFITAGYGGVVFTSNDNGETWVKNSVLNSDYLGIAYGNRTFVVAGGTDHQGYIVTSSDGGVTWSPSNYPLTSDFHGVAFGNNLFISVGVSGQIFTSADNGANWVAQNSPTTAYLTDIAFGNGRFVAVGYNGTILTSSDLGTTWFQVPCPTEKNLIDIAYGNGRFVIVGESGTILVSNFLEGPKVSDLSVTMTDNTDPVVIGQNLIYEINVTNNGPDQASFVRMVDSLPSQFNLTSVSSSKGNCVGTTTITCDLGTLDTGTSATITIQGTPTSNPPGTIINIASVSTDSTDPNLVNNSATESTTVVQNYYSIVSSSGANGTISPSGPISVPFGGSQTFAISPNAGYSIADVMVDGVSLGPISSYNFSNVTSNHTISTNFIMNYSITSTSGPNGTISPLGQIYISYEGIMTYAILPNAGYAIADVQVDGQSVGSVPSYTFSNLASNHTISASFTPITGIGGIITDSSGNRASGACVAAFDYYSGAYVMGTGTYPDGSYSLSVPAGDYKVRTDPCNVGGYAASKWYIDTINPNNANKVTVIQGSATPVNISLGIGGAIEGRVTSDGTTGISGIAVQAFDDMNNLYWGTTANDGTYRMVVPGGVVTPLTYRLIFNPYPDQNPPDGVDYLPQTYKNKQATYENPHPTPDLVYVLNNQPARNIDGFTNIDAQLMLGGVVTGRVFDAATLEPINNACVSAGAYGNMMFQTNTGHYPSDPGRYYITTIPTGPSTTNISVFDCGGQFGSDSYTLTQSKILPLAVDQGPYPNQIDFAITKGGKISGKIYDATNPNTPIPNACVSILDSNGNWLSGTQVNSDGTYKTNVLAPGASYNVRVDQCNATGYYLFNKYYTVPVTVSAGQTTPNIDIGLNQGGAIAGRVVNSQGTPISRISVAVSDLNCNYITGGNSGNDGTFSIVLPLGSYKINFWPWNPDQYYQPMYWYNNRTNCSSATQVSVTTIGTSNTLPDVVLSDGGRISGQVTDLNGVGLANVNVNVYNLSNILISVTRTDSGGNYNFPIAPGTYKIQFNPGSTSNYVLEWYSHKPTFADANQVVITSGQTTANINAQLATYQTLTISGYVLDGTGVGIANVVMNGLSGSPRTGTNGFYSGTVNYAWSPTWTGDIIPGKSGYLFNPAYRSYKNINSNQTDQDFIGTWISTPSAYYDQFSETDLDSSKWGSWQVREIQDFNGDRKLFSKTVAYDSTVASNRLEIKNPSAINHMEADVSVTDIGGNYGDANTLYTLPTAGLAGIFYNNGTGSALSYVGEVLAQVRIVPDGDNLRSEWVVYKYSNSSGSSWDVLGSATLSNSLILGQSYRLSLDWDPATKVFTFGDGISSQQTFVTPDNTIVSAKIGWKSLRTMVFIGDNTRWVTVPDLWGKVSATFDNVKACQDTLCNTVLMTDDFSSANLDAGKWSGLEQSSGIDVGTGQLISKVRNSNTNNRNVNVTNFRNPGQINEFQVKATLQAYQNTTGVNTTARIGGNFYNDTGNPNSGYQGDVWAQVAINSGVPGQAPYAQWVVLRFNDPISSHGNWTILGSGNFPMSINIGQAYNLYIKWDGTQFIFKCDDYAAFYAPSTSIFPPNFISRTLGTNINPPNPYAGFQGSVTAAFDEVVVNGTGQSTPVGTNISIQPRDPSTGATPATLTFSQVSQDGMTALTVSNQGLPIPQGFKLGDPPIYYEISTTASFTGSINVSINYNGIQYTDENALRLLHFENGSWVDCTTSVDTVNKIIYGTVSSLSPFVIVEIANRPPVLAHIGNQIVSEGQQLLIVLSATDPDGNSLIYSTSNLPTGATFDPGTQTFSWTPTYGQAGSYPNIIFTVTDNGNPMKSASEEITITVSNANRPPILNPIGNRQIAEGQTLQFTISATDPDGNGLTYSTGNLPEGASFNPITRIFSWTPTFDQAGNYTDILFKVSDDDPDNPLTTTESITITVNNINRPPDFAPIGDKSIQEGATMQFTVTATDPDGNNLTYSANNLPAGADFDPATQTFTWMPAYDQAGNYPNIEFTVMDDGSPMELSTQMITISVGNVNRAPVFTLVGTQQALEGQQLQFTVSANDYDGDSIIYSTGPLPVGAYFDANTKKFTWTPDYTQAGLYVVNFMATDNYVEPATGAISVVINVGNVPTPTEMANNIINTVVGLNLAKAVENSYMANLKKVTPFIEGGKITPAINQLDAFIHKVQQDISYGKINASDGNNLISMANALIAKIQG